MNSLSSFSIKKNEKNNLKILIVNKKSVNLI